MSKELSPAGEVFFAVPKPSAILQDVKDIDCLSLIKELIDNGIAYSGDVKRVYVSYTKDLPGGPALRVYDLGCGMDETGVREYFREGHTTAGAGPTLARGSLSSFKFGARIELVSRQKGSRVEHVVTVDVKQWLEENTHKCIYRSRPYTGPDICDKHGQTTLTIQDLKKEVLDMLEDEQTKKLWFSQVQQDYYFFVYAVPKELWAALPPKMTIGSQRPTGGFLLNFLGNVMDPAAEPAEESFTEDTPELLRVFAMFKTVCRTHPGLKLCCNYTRHWPTAGADATTSAGPSSASRRGSASEQPTKRQKVQAPQAPTSEAGRTAAAPMTADEQWERKKKPVDLLTIYFYFPFSASGRTKPCRPGEAELFMLPFWCGRRMTGQKALLSQDQASKLDGSRLVGFVFMSPDGDVSSHKTELAGPAFEDDEGHVVNGNSGDHPLVPRDLAAVWGYEFRTSKILDNLHANHGCEGELVILLPATTGRAATIVNPSAKFAPTVPRVNNIHWVHLFYENKIGTQHAVVSSWRPKWGDQGRVQHVPILRLEPMQSAPPSGLGGFGKVGQRKVAWEALALKLEATSPRWLRFTADLSGKEAVSDVGACTYLRLSYAVNDEKPMKVCVVVATGGTSTAPAKPAVFSNTSWTPKFETNMGIQLYYERPKPEAAADGEESFAPSKQVWTTTVAPEAKKASIIFMATGWPEELLSRPGRYTFFFKPDQAPPGKGDTRGWFDVKALTLSYQFVVESAKPVAMRARWERCAGEQQGVLAVRVGERVPSAIILQLLDDEGKAVSASHPSHTAQPPLAVIEVACPLHPQQLVSEACTVKMVGPGAAGMAQRHMPQNVRCEYVDSSRQEVRVTLHSFPHQMITSASGPDDVPVSSSDRQLQVTLGIDGGTAAEGGEGALLSQPLHFLLASGAYTQLLLKDNSKTIFASTPQQPFQVTKGDKVFDDPEEFVLCDKSGNPFHRLDSDPVPPPLVLKAGPGISMKAAGKRSAAARAAGQLDSREFAYKAASSSYILDVNSCEMVAVPGSKCELTAEVLKTGRKLTASLVSRPVILGVERKESAGVCESVLSLVKYHGTAAWTTMSVPPEVVAEVLQSHQPGHLHRSPAASLQQHLEFGGTPVLLSPRGECFPLPSRGGAGMPSRDKLPVELITLLNRLKAAAMVPCFDLAFTVPVDASTLDKVRLTFSDYEDDEVQEGFVTSLRVPQPWGTKYRPRCTKPWGQRALTSTPTRRSTSRRGEAVLRPMPLSAMFERAASDRQWNGHTVTLGVEDTSEQKFKYGSFYVRQAPHPSRLSLAPVQGGLLEGRTVSTGCGPRGGADPAPPQRRGVLQPPRVQEGMPPPPAGSPLVFQLSAAAPTPRGAAAPPGVGIGQLVRDGFVVDTPGPCPAARRFKLDFLVLDQHGFPMAIPPSLRASFAASATACLQLGVTDSSTCPDPHSAQEYDGSDLPCKLTSWLWGDSDPARGVSHSSVLLNLPAGLAQGPAQVALQLAIDPAQHAATIPAHIHSLALLFPLSIGEYRERLAADGLTFQSATEIAAGAAASAGATHTNLEAVVVKPERGLSSTHMCIMLSCEEDRRLHIVLSLKAFDGSVARDTAFSLRETSLPGVQALDVSSVNGTLEITLQLGSGEAWCMPHSLTLQAAEPGYAHVPDIKLSLDISPGCRVKAIQSQCEWPTQLLDVTAPHDSLPGTVHLAMSLANGGEEAGGQGLFPPMKLKLLTANGKGVEPGQLQMLRLAYEVQEASRDGAGLLWKLLAHYDMAPEDAMTYRCQDQQLFRKTGTFKVTASYPGDSSSCPPCSTNPQLKDPERCTTLSSAQALEAALPPLSIQLTDRWGNPTTCAHRLELCLMTQASQPEGAAPGQAAAQMQPIPEDQHGAGNGSSSSNGGGSSGNGGSSSRAVLPAGTSATTLPSRTIATLGIAQDSGDTSLFLVPTVLPAAATRGSSTAAPPPLPQLQRLKLATFYISAGDDLTLRNSITALNDSVAAAKLRLSSCTASLQAARIGESAATHTLKGLQRRLQEEEGLTDVQQALAQAVADERLADELSARVHEEFRGAHLEDSGGRLPQPRPRTQIPRSRALAYEEMAVSVSRVPGGMGPLMLLGAVERNDVNLALLGHLGVKAKLLVVQGSEGDEAIGELDCCKQGALSLDLASPNVYHRYQLHQSQVDSSSPQLPLRFANLRAMFRGVLDMDGTRPGASEGFVGMAVNLIHLSPSMQAKPVSLPANAAEMASRRGTAASPDSAQYSLRQTLWHYLLGDVMVFENQAAITAFKQRCAKAGVMLKQRVLGLDGSSLNMLDVGISQKNTVASRAGYSGEYLLPGVPVPVQQVCPLDLRIVRDKAEMKRLQERALRLRFLSTQLPAAHTAAAAAQQATAAQQEAFLEVKEVTESQLVALEARLTQEKDRLGKQSTQGRDNFSKARVLGGGRAR
ncbi:MAG: hypothetical protein WDW38_009256 [Sanguina aurantia]